MLVDHATVLPLLWVCLHALDVRGQQPSHACTHCKSYRRDHVLSGETLHYVKVEGDAVIDETLGGGHIQHHHLQHAETKGALQGITPTPKMLHEGGEELQSRDGVAILVQMHKIHHLRPCERGGHAGLGQLLLRRYVWPVVVQERPHMKRLAQVNLLLSKRGHDGRGLPDVAVEHDVRDAMLAEIDCSSHPRLFIEVHTHHSQWILLKDSASGSVLLDVRINVHQEVTVPRAGVHHKLGLILKVFAAEHDIDMLHKVFEQRLMLCSASDDVQRPLHMNLCLLSILPCIDETPTSILEEDGVEFGQHGRIRCGDIIGVTSLQG
mmetsp:Transcript_74987/g.135050  ORF Transcript_74987/g.135050 Transcript_74987/m.135050 type:complete len:322 (+) Transcript_74987:1352-2317(+)